MENKSRIPLRSGRLKLSILLALLGALCAASGLYLDCLKGYFPYAFHINPEMLLCLGFVLCVYLSQINPCFMLLPYGGLVLYSGYMIISSLPHYQVVALIYLLVLICLFVLFVLVAASRMENVRFFVIGNWFLIVLVFIGSLFNEGPYFTFTRYENMYSYAVVFVGKALGAMCLLWATNIWVLALSRDWNTEYYEPNGFRGLRSLSLDWFAVLRKY